MFRVPHLGLFQSTFIWARYLGSRAVLVFIVPAAVYYEDATSQEKNLANLTFDFITWVSPFRMEQREISQLQWLQLPGNHLLLFLHMWKDKAEVGSRDCKLPQLQPNSSSSTNAGPYIRQSTWALSLNVHKCWVSQCGTAWTQLHGFPTGPPADGDYTALYTAGNCTCTSFSSSCSEFPSSNPCPRNWTVIQAAVVMLSSLAHQLTSFTVYST